MYTKRAELTAGLVVIAGLAAFIWFLYMATGKGFFEKHAHWYVRFDQGDSAPGVGDDVMYLGLVIGRVSQVWQRAEVRTGDKLTEADRKRLEKEPPGTPEEVREIYVLAEMELPLEQTLPRGTTARLSKSAVTNRPTLHLLPGISRIDLKPEDTRERPIHGGHGATFEEIAENINAFITKLSGSTEGVGGVIEEARLFLQELRAKLADLDTKTMNDNVVAATESLKRTLAVAERDIETIVTNVREASGDFRSLAAAGAEAIEKAKADIAVILADVKAAAARVNEVIQEGAPKVERFLDSIDATAKEIQKVAVDLQGVGADVKAIIGRAGGNLDSILSSLDDMGRNLLDVSEDLRANPWKLTNKPDGTVIAFENLKAASLTYVRAMTSMERATRHMKEILASPNAATPEAKRALTAALAAFAKAQEDFALAQRRFTELLQQAGPRGGR
jgi:ABC-type transporter Mla subunit MlaD